MTATLDSRMKAVDAFIKGVAVFAADVVVWKFVFSRMRTFPEDGGAIGDSLIVHWATVIAMVGGICIAVPISLVASTAFGSCYSYAHRKPALSLDITGCWSMLVCALAVIGALVPITAP